MKTHDRDFRIGILSKRTGVNIETIRYYESVGILPSPPRSDGGYRIYDEFHFSRLSFVRRARELGFSLEEIRDLLRLADAEETDCGAVRSITLQHLQNVKDKMRDLRKLERTLTRISNACGDGAAPECPIIEALSKSN